MNLYIPEIGDLILLTEDWFFKLHYEHRNDGLITASKLGDLSYHSSWRTAPKTPIEMDLPKGTVLAIDRIYIRKGASDYSSITFRIKKCIISDFEGKRFWAKLSDCNTIQFEKLIDEAKKEKPKPSECKITLIDGTLSSENLNFLYPELDKENWKKESDYTLNVGLLLTSKESPTPLKGSVSVKFSTKEGTSFRSVIKFGVINLQVNDLVCKLNPLNGSNGITINPLYFYNNQFLINFREIEKIFSKDPSKIARYFKG